MGTPLGEAMQVIPVMRPKLPSADQVLPYLRRLDSSRIYSNWGPLVSEFEGRLCEHFALPAGSVVTASSGTAALVGAILAAAGRATPERPYALIPAYTFVATAAAAEQCGYVPYLADVDVQSWALNAATLLGHSALKRIGVVIPVAPYGRPVPQAPWQAFRAETGIPVVIDGAACFDGISAWPAPFLGAIPVAMSFHATKCFGSGEGGCVVSVDEPNQLQAIARALNFGCYGDRVSRSAGTNGKMSEYHAAVGLAELSGWKDKQSLFRNVINRYQHHLGAAGLLASFHSAPDLSACYALYVCTSASEAARMQELLYDRGVDSRLWYGNGLHHHPSLKHAPRDDLEVTEEVAPKILGIPMAVDLTDSDIARVVDALVDSLGAISSPEDVTYPAAAQS
jgi:dTDP-4-amino-4,6-dideoxygalactose transaminase